MVLRWQILILEDLMKLSYSLPEKNGKTTFIAAIDLAEFFLSKGGVDIVCASNTN